MKDKILASLRSHDVLSGQKLAEMLGVSRTAIWKQVNTLRSLGYEIEATQNKGYRLLSSPDIPLEAEVAKGLQTTIIGRSLRYLSSVSSTNSYATSLIHEGAEEGTVVVADIQTKGRGRKQRPWISPPGGLWFSIILYPPLPPTKAMLVTMASSLAVVETIQQTLDLPAVIKWPNDVLLNGKKACGVLTELDAEMDQLHYIVVGIGINVNNTLESYLKHTATSLQQEKGSRVSRVHLLREILTRLDSYYMLLLKGKLDYIRTRWLSYTSLLHKNIRVTTINAELEGTVVSVDDDGSLIIKTEKGTQRILSGDITYL
jgi:BirA family biotin operon repressor/biotin-[acetyl-CoA-carboxylase] ligase